MNDTTREIIGRLPRRPLLTPADVAAAYGLAGASAVIADIKCGRLAAQRVGGRYVVSRAAAEAYIAANEYAPEEGTV